MEEEIDIIELLQRVKEGKAPKEIEIDNVKFIISTYPDVISYLYVEKYNMSKYWNLRAINLDTKIKILDKPIIEELEMVKSMDGKISAYPNEEMIFEKINEIIRHINKGE